MILCTARHNSSQRAVSGREDNISLLLQCQLMLKIKPVMFVISQWWQKCPWKNKRVCKSKEWIARDAWAGGWWDGTEANGRKASVCPLGRIQQKGLWENGIWRFSWKRTMEVSKWGELMVRLQETKQQVAGLMVLPEVKIKRQVREGEGRMLCGNVDGNFLLLQQQKWRIKERTGF